SAILDALFVRRAPPPRILHGADRSNRRRARPTSREAGRPAEEAPALLLDALGAGANRGAGLLGRLRRSLRLQEDDRGLDRHQDGGLSSDGHPTRVLA